VARLVRWSESLIHDSVRSIPGKISLIRGLLRLIQGSRRLVRCRESLIRGSKEVEQGGEREQRPRQPPGAGGRGRRQGGQRLPGIELGRNGLAPARQLGSEGWRERESFGGRITASADGASGR
jgi:hypothetical protein